MGGYPDSPSSDADPERPGTALPGAVPSNLPAALSSFIGRGDTIQELRRALATRRLLTVVGPGGAGKTRLVREVAAAIAESPEAASGFSHGIWWVELASVQLGSDVATTVAGALGVFPTAGRRPVDALAEALRGQQLLLVLDNCEHVLQETAVLVDLVLRAAPGVTVLCTSREALSVEGEVAWPIPALPRPSSRDMVGAAEVAGFEAVQLFAERARAVAPSFQLSDANATAVAAICDRLDGLPLALELAAAVVPVLGVEALAARLDNALTLLSRGRRAALPRHQTLHAVLDWSYALLSQEERALLRQLSVFRGSFSLEAMEQVCGTPGLALVPALGRLVEHSLVEVREEEGEATYRLLETVRQFGTAQLRGTPEERAVRERHARWIADLAIDAEPALFSPARGRTVEWLRHSVDDIRAALAWTSSPAGAPRVGVKIAGALGWFWLSGLPWEEGRALLARTLVAADALGVADDELPIEEQVALGRLLYPLEGLAYFAGDADAILVAGRRAVAVWTSVEATPGLSDTHRLAAARGHSLACQLIGLAHGMRGEAAPAVEQMDAAIAIIARVGDPWLLAVLTMRRALVYFMIGDFARAQADYDAAVPPLRAQGELWFLSLALEGMAMNAMALGDAVAAARHARESVTVLRPEPDPWFISRSLDTMAFVLTSRRDPPGLASDEPLHAAARLLGAADALRRRCGAQVIGPDLARHAEMTESLRARLGPDAYDRSHAAGTALTLADVFGLMDHDPVVSAFTTGPAAATREVVRLALKVLGPLVMPRRDGAEPGEALPAGKVRELLLFLLLNERATKDQIGLALWPDASAAQVRNIFHVTLHHLRRQLGPERWIVSEQGAYRLERSPSPEVTLEVDVDLLLATAAQLRKALRRREEVTPAALDQARQVLEQCNADLAPGFAGGEWLVSAQDRVRAAWVDGADALAQLYQLAGRTAEVMAICELLVAREPLRESAHRLLMEAMASRGEVARALAHYEALVALLHREVGARPAQETRTLAERLRR